MGSGGSKKKNAVINGSATKLPSSKGPTPKIVTPSNDSRKNSHKEKGVTISEETLKEFLEYEKEIKNMRNKKILADFQVKVLQREHLEMAIIKADAECKQLEANAMKEAMDVEKLKDKDIKQTLMEQGTYESCMEKEVEEHIDALNKQEVQRKEIENMLAQKKKLDDDIEMLSKEGDRLQDMVVKQDKLLHEIFDGEYGSELENQLEKELVTLEEQKNYIDQAFYKWKKAQTGILQAVKQFSPALEDWKKISETSEMEEKYVLGTKTRNALIAAMQNMQGAQMLLFNITFPYCNKEELDTLNGAITYIFTDMQTAERHEHARQCYDTTYRRAAALHQWMTQVINQAIVRDLEAVTEATKNKSSELKQERVSLIIKMIKEKGGTCDYDAVSVADEDLCGSPEADLYMAENAADQASPVMPTPIATAELPPIPCRDDILGQVEHLKKQHDQEKADFFSAQDKNLNVVKLKLQERLNQRRTRRSNSIMNAREVQFLKAK